MHAVSGKADCEDECKEADDAGDERTKAAAHMSKVSHADITDIGRGLHGFWTGSARILDAVAHAFRTASASRILVVG